MYSFMDSFAALILLRRGRVSLSLHYTKSSESPLMLVVEGSWVIRAWYLGSETDMMKLGQLKGGGDGRPKWCFQENEPP